MVKQLPEAWQKNKPAIKAIQVAFDLDEEIGQAIKLAAVKSGLSPSAQIRKILGLSYSIPKRPRLTTSLNDEDYILLGERFAIAPTDKIAIRSRIIALLAEEVSDL
ncbi:MAG: hypothetical protein Q9M31_06300 [Mariprofundus sp.]|nr:hypothetical protein [Mariprofundus sp.]